jgi:hypothetical protein
MFTKQKDPQALTSYASPARNYSTHSIPYLALELVQEEPSFIGIDSFTGSNREFRLYLAAQKILIKIGEIA